MAGLAVTYVKIASWHVEAMTYRSGMVKTRCGLLARVEGTLSKLDTPGVPIRISPTSETLPLGEPSCETCTRLVLHDQEQAAVLL